ncbi:ABC-type phosphate transport system, periplasmic component [Candidatus Scalindua japonica]|uniref:ABC-type phosphate transport system, periplasmic component n=1 Tax=Candidatus Scalindua japonica TaxID=1284222 RepID=A0A286TWE4_9BACT|nr:hypothetical protein [Candidatus Scalindua japonica]GAX60195.1 ABC-type phosphate transport system, periplasmic component [Candidatus Scalindua japonica]
MNNKHCVYIVIIAGLLSVTACIRDVVQEAASPEEYAIELALTCIVVDEEVSGVKMNARDAIALWEKEPVFTPVGWEAIDVDESEYFVVFNYRVNNIDQLWAFHVVSGDGTVERIGIGKDGLDGDRYMSRIISTSSYPRKELEKKLKKVIEKLMFQ